MTLTNLEDDIFNRYQDHCDICAPGRALPDGCPNPEQFQNAQFRALFVLKEAHGWEVETNYPRDLRQFARDGGIYKTWGNLARWSALMENPAFVNAQFNARDPQERSEKLAYCGFINLKKVPGGTRSKNNEIEAFAVKHASLLKEQFGLYKPHVTIACGTFAALRDLYKAEEQTSPLSGFHFLTNDDLGTVIEFYHPQYLAKTPDDYLQLLKSNLVYHFPERFH